MSALEQADLAYTLNPGEGAFYGPKLEFVLKDALGRDWQCGTWQLDFVLPQRLGASYMGEDGKIHCPVMLHKAIFGTFERFIGILIEHYAGKFPLWLAPVQVVVASITTGVNDYAQHVCDHLKARGIRAEIDLRNEKISYKIREHSLQKVPYVLVVGQKEAEQGMVAVRMLGGETQEIVSLDEITHRLMKTGAMPV